MSVQSISAEMDDALCRIARRHTSVRASKDETVDWGVVSTEFIRYVEFIQRRTATGPQRVLEATMFTPKVCQQRIRYILWRHSQKKPPKTKVGTTRQEGKAVSKSLKELFAEVEKHLPTISSDSEDDDDEDTRPVEVFKAAQDFETQDGIALSAEASDTQLQKWQNEEVQYYQKTGSWLTRNLDEMTKDDVAWLLDALDLSEHKEGFRRSDGRLLKGMTKEDIIRRFGNDAEAADILWGHLEKARTMFGGVGFPTPARPSTATPSKTSTNLSPSPLQQSRTAGQPQKPKGGMPPEMREVFDNALGRSGNKVTQGSVLDNTEKFKEERTKKYEQWLQSSGVLQDIQKSGDLSAIKRAMFPDRPGRPSKDKSYVDPADMWGEEVLKSESSYDRNPYAASKTTLDMSAVDGLDLEQAIARLEREENAAKPTPKGTSRPPTAPAAQTSSASKPLSVPPKRGGGNRWEVVEYSDEEADQ